MASWVIILSILGVTLAIPTPEAPNVEDEIVNSLQAPNTNESETVTAVDPSKLTKLDGRIVGGHAVQIEDYPYQLSLQYYGSHICGAAIITPSKALTAAHCTDGVRNPSVFSVRAGSTRHNSGGTSHRVKSINQHPSYNPRTIDYDISVLELTSPISDSRATRVIAMNDAGGLLYNGVMCTVTGWGALSEGGSAPPNLQAVNLPIVGNEQCNRAYGGSITPRMVCAGFQEGGKDACQGDSGGPLVSGGKLVGVVSWGYGCARPNYPGVYADVGAHRDYIDNVGQ